MENEVLKYQNTSILDHQLTPNLVTSILRELAIGSRGNGSTQRLLLTHARSRPRYCLHCPRDPFNRCLINYRCTGKQETRFRQRTDKAVSTMTTLAEIHAPATVADSCINRTMKEVTFDRRAWASMYETARVPTFRRVIR